jgi:hypothetical protein
LRGIKATDRKILVLTAIYNAEAVEHDIIKIPRIVTTKDGERVDMITSQTVTDSDFVAMKKRGDYTLNNFYGYQKVRYASGEPLMIADRKNNDQYVYKLINLLGDGNRASEYYPDNRPSVIDNASAKIDNELTDAEVVEMYEGKVTEKITKEKATLEQIEQIEDSKEFAKAMLNYVGAKETTKGLKIDGQHYFVDNKQWYTQEKTYGYDLYITPENQAGTEYEEVYIASSFTGSPEFFSDEAEGRANADRINKETPVTEEVTKDDIEKALDAGVKAGFTREELQVVSIDGKPIAMSDSFYPDKITKGYSTFYSQGRDMLIKRSGKSITIPGHENIRLVMEQGTREVFELSTGLSVGSNLVKKTIAETLEAVKEKFDRTPTLQETINNSKKIKINDSGVSIVNLTTGDKSVPLNTPGDKPGIPPSGEKC